MKKLEKIVRSLCDKDNEQEWFELKGCILIGENPEGFS